jgi:hypothetical protein
MKEVARAAKTALEPKNLELNPKKTGRKPFVNISRRLFKIVTCFGMLNNGRTWPGDLAIITPRVILCQTRWKH